jgi:hypothetical protein
MNGSRSTRFRACAASKLRSRRSSHSRAPDEVPYFMVAAPASAH